MALSDATSGIVMLVDDNPGTLKMLIEALENVGMTALVARDGASALKILERVDPDVILLDAVMPGMSGFEVCRQIKMHPSHMATPILFMTGLSDTEHVIEGLEAGGVDYIIKPIVPSELIARLSIHLANARTISDARRAVDAADASIVALDANAKLAWISKAATQAIEEIFGVGGLNKLQALDTLKPWLERVVLLPLSAAPPFEVEDGNGNILRITFAGKNTVGESLGRVSMIQNPDPLVQIQATFALSHRESEVLLWLSRGKANRDIATILNVSPRTVTKHVETVLSKLSVENRTAAAVLTLQKCDF